MRAEQKGRITSLCRAALNPVIPCYILIVGSALTPVQDFVLGLDELHQVHVDLLFKPIKVPLDGIPSHWCINCTTQLAVICKLVEGALKPTVYVISADIKQY